MSSVRPGGFQMLPPVVKNLIIINVLMALLQFVLIRRGIDLSDYLGLHYWKSYYFKPWQYITYMFMHGSPDNVSETVMHLFSNMFPLWMFGSMLENLWGPKRFLTFYLVCGLGAALCHLAVVGYDFHILNQNVLAFQHNPTADQFSRMLQQNDWQSIPPFRNLSLAWESDPGADGFRQDAINMIEQYLHGYTDPVFGGHAAGLFDQTTVGASGAVFGILLAFGYLFPNMLLYFLFAIPIKAKWFVMMYGAFELYYVIRANPGDNVAHLAHLGGMLFGYLLLRAWRMRPNQYS
jgi:membrane associated rhomboid family serine protease